MTRLLSVTIKIFGKSPVTFLCLAPQNSIAYHTKTPTSITLSNASSETESITIEDAPELAQSKQELSSLMARKGIKSLEALTGMLFFEHSSVPDSQKKTPSSKPD